GWSDPCIFLFFCRFGIFHPRSHSSTHTHLLVPAAHFCARGVCNFASLTPSRGVGGAPRNVRVQRHPWGVHITRHARRLARRLAAHAAGRSPLGAPPWRFWAPGPRFSHRHSRRIGYSELLAARSWGRAGGVPSLPGRTVKSRRRRTPRLAPPSGCLRTTPSMSEAANI